jgi:photosystem II stability/assembly factor-like uncharacterized protein
MYLHELQEYCNGQSKSIFTIPQEVLPMTGRAIKTIMALSNLLLGALLSGVFGQAHWVWRNPSPTGNSLFDITYAKARFVAVGGSGSVLTSADGKKWTEENVGSDRSLYAVAYGAQQCVAVGDSGTILTSSDAKV